MSEIKKLILKDVRCFEGRKEFNIRPLTFLVGENSTGKSTALGCFQVLNDFLSFNTSDVIDFNIEPYQMGSFSDIARKTKSQVKEFELGYQIHDMEYRLNLIARKDGSEPIIKKVIMRFHDGEIRIEGRPPENHNSPDGKSRVRNIDLQESGDNIFTLSCDKDYFNWLRSPEDMYSLLEMYKGEMKGDVSSEFKKCMKFLLGHIKRGNYEILDQHYMLETGTSSFAPIRSKPERTYNPLKETANPEGGEMPVALMNFSVSNKSEWDELKTSLENFGKSSGLFTGISVRKLGRSMSDPFQLQIKVRGPKGNIVDVGYGVSQILPILVRVLLSKKGKFLLQQPEVHLHPKGQAELASLLIGMAGKRKSFAVETHSDAMINRARIEIMQGKIAPEDVSLIFLEPKGNKVEVHNISFDKQGNMQDAPNSYGDFFLDESNKLLGFGD